MQQLQNYALIWILAVLMAGCASMTTPETNLERLSYMEISYGVILDKATLYRNEGRLSDSQISMLDKAFDDYESARTLAKTAIDVGEQGNFDNSAATMVTILSALRSVLSEVEQ